MKIYVINSLLVILLFSFISCDEVTQNNSNVIEGDWLIPEDQVFDGGPGKDGIPALENPAFIDVSEADYLTNEDLIIGIKIGTEVRGYPHAILDWHEIINDDLGNKSYAITYCPLTGSGIAWNRIIEGVNTTFGVSGLLYNTNLIPYDRVTDSEWSQMLMKSVNGERRGKDITTLNIIETNLFTWRVLFPGAPVVSVNTGYNRQYGRYPYGGYRTNSALIFPISNDDTRLPRKERVLGVLVEGNAAAFQLSEFPEHTEVRNTIIGARNIAIAGNSRRNIIKAYYPELENGKEVELKTTDEFLPIVMEDEFGNTYDLFGDVIHGPDIGMRLKSPKSFIAYWFAWAAFYPNTTLN